MASSKEYLEFILGQLSELEEITYRAMMGEFIIYYRGKIVGGIYDHIYIRNCSGCGIAGSSFFTRTYVCEYYMLGCMGCTVLCCILSG
mgnify:CR=1 FL=1